MSENHANTSKKHILVENDFIYIDISNGKKSNFLKPESGSEKNQLSVQIVNPLHG